MDSLLRMHGYRVTKYDPRLRDSRGRFSTPQWTSISDVGKGFGGVTFTQAEYEEVEVKYLASIRLFARDSSIRMLRVRELEPAADWDETNYISPNTWLSLDQAIVVAQHVLREELWCKLEMDGQFHIHFGYDYYMYIESVFECTAAIEEVRASGLFVEENFVSPYRLASDEERG